MIDERPIVVILTGFRVPSKNAKSGGSVLQTWILRSDIDPVGAARVGEDASICGACRHRGTLDADGVNVGRSCYVNIGTSVRNTWLAYKRGSYARVADISVLGTDRGIRLGTYGDPAAVPVGIWEALTTKAAWCIGYTHQWRWRRALRGYCMASVDTPEEKAEAALAGWRTFRVRSEESGLFPREIACPASHEAGRKTGCEDCRACGGHSSRAARVDVAIVAHGPAGRVGNFLRGTDAI